MADILTWTYLVNSVLLIDHEIDSAYWKEWDLLKLPGGIAGFLAMHVPLVFAILLGLIMVYQHSFAGLIFSLVLSFAGMLAFLLHLFYIRRGRTEFKTPISLSILSVMMVTSLFQAAITVSLLCTH